VKNIANHVGGTIANKHWGKVIDDIGKNIDCDTSIESSILDDIFVKITLDIQDVIFLSIRNVSDNIYNSITNK